MTTSLALALAVEDALAALPGRTLAHIHDDAVYWAIAEVEKMDILPDLETWKKEEQKGPGRPPGGLSMKAILVAMLLAAVSRQGMLATVWDHILHRQISPAMRIKLHVPDPPPDPQFVANEAERDVAQRLCDNLYETVRRRFKSYLVGVDPNIYPLDRQYTPEEFKARTKDMSEEEIAEKKRRLFSIGNRIVRPSIDLLPKEIFDLWNGATVLDATPLPLFAQGFFENNGYMSTDMTGGWYMRTAEDHKDPNAVPIEKILTRASGVAGKKGALRNSPRVKKAFWAVDATIAAMGPDAPAEHYEYPFLVLGFTLDQPGFRVGENGALVVEHLAELGYPAGWLAGDRAYAPSAKPEHYQDRVRPLGYHLVMDYKKDHCGQLRSVEGFLDVDGGRFCPAMSNDLINAYKDYRNGKIGYTTYIERVKARRPWQAGVKEYLPEEDKCRWECPARRGLCKCVLAPESMDLKGVPQVLHPPSDPPKCCTQKSVGIDNSVGSRELQDLLHGSDEWHAIYATLRQIIEGVNGIAKDGSYEALGVSTRRRLRGPAAQMLIVAFLLYAVNLRKIRTFLLNGRTQPDGRFTVKRAKERKLDRRETSRRRRVRIPGGGSRAAPVEPAAAAS